MRDIQRIVADKVLEPPQVDVGAYVEAIADRYGDKLVGVFMYGSMLSQVTAAADSFPDFFVITDGYAGVFDDWRHRASAYPLPPHIYHLRLDDGRHAKYNLVSLQRFRRETSRWASDIYILGRFGKRTALVFSRDAAAQRELTACCFSAMANVAVWTLRGMSEAFDDEAFTLACLNISYAGETRVEAGSKVPKLYRAEADFYDAVYPQLLRRWPACRRLAEPTAHGCYRPSGGEGERWLRRQAFEWFLTASRVRGVLRWPKFLLTVEGWVDIILAKIERTKGIRLDPSPAARRYPLLLGWPHFFRLLRQGAIGATPSDARIDKNTQ
jgi:hypothetical protein